MHEKLNEIERVTYSKVGELLFEIVPDYKAIKIEDVSGILGNYTFLNEYALSLANKISEENNSLFVSNSIDFINILSESNNLEVINLLKVGILEILYTSNLEIRQFLLTRLNSKNQLFFSSFSKFYS